MRLPSADHAQRKPDRFNYTGMHRYIVTLPLYPGVGIPADPSHVFLILNTLRDISHHHHFDVYAYCFLPKQLVVIIRGREETSDMKLFLSAFRKESSAAVVKIGMARLWSRKYLERVLRKTEDSKSAAKEVFMMPVRLGLVAAAGDYNALGSFVVSTASILSPSSFGHGTGKGKSFPPKKFPPKTGRRPPPDRRKKSPGGPRDRFRSGKRPPGRKTGNNRP